MLIMYIRNSSFSGDSDGQDMSWIVYLHLFCSTTHAKFCDYRTTDIVFRFSTLGHGLTAQSVYGFVGFR